MTGSDRTGQLPTDGPKEFDLLTPKQVAQEFHISEVTLARWRRKGNDPRYPKWIKLSRKIWYDRKDLYEWIRNQRDHPNGKK